MRRPTKYAQRIDHVDDLETCVLSDVRVEIPIRPGRRHARSIGVRLCVVKRDHPTPAHSRGPIVPVPLDGGVGMIAVEEDEVELTFQKRRGLPTERLDELHPVGDPRPTQLRTRDQSAPADSESARKERIDREQPPARSERCCDPRGIRSFEHTDFHGSTTVRRPPDQGSLFRSGRLSMCLLPAKDAPNRVECGPSMPHSSRPSLKRSPPPASPPSGPRP